MHYESLKIDIKKSGLRVDSEVAARKKELKHPSKSEIGKHYDFKEMAALEKMYHDIIE